MFKAEEAVDPVVCTTVKSSLAGKFLIGQRTLSLKMHSGHLLCL